MKRRVFGAAVIGLAIVTVVTVAKAQTSLPSLTDIAMRVSALEYLIASNNSVSSETRRQMRYAAQMLCTTSGGGCAAAYLPNVRGDSEAVIDYFRRKAKMCKQRTGANILSAQCPELVALKRSVAFEIARKACLMDPSTMECVP